MICSSNGRYVKRKSALSSNTGSHSGLTPYGTVIPITLVTYEAFRSDNELVANEVIEFLGCDRQEHILTQPQARVQSSKSKRNSFVNYEDVKAHLGNLGLLTDRVVAT